MLSQVLLNIIMSIFIIVISGSSRCSAGDCRNTNIVSGCNGSRFGSSCSSSIKLWQIELIKASDMSFTNPATTLAKLIAMTLHTKDVLVSCSILVEA